jgi:hypothetical protein
MFGLVVRRSIPLSMSLLTELAAVSVGRHYRHVAPNGACPKHALEKGLYSAAPEQ